MYLKKKNIREGLWPPITDDKWRLHAASNKESSFYMWLHYVLGDGGNVQRPRVWNGVSQPHDGEIGFNVLCECDKVYTQAHRQVAEDEGTRGHNAIYTVHTHLPSFIESCLLNRNIIIKCTFSSSVCKHSYLFVPSSRHWRPTAANGPCRSWTFCFWPAQLDTLWAWRPAASSRRSTKLGTFCSTPCVSPCSKMSVASTSGNGVCPRMKRNTSSPPKTVGAPAVLLQKPAQRSGWLWPRPSLLWPAADCCAPSTKRGCSGLIFLMWDTGLTGGVYFWLVQMIYPWIKETETPLISETQRRIRWTWSFEPVIL